MPESTFQALREAYKGGESLDKGPGVIWSPLPSPVNLSLKTSLRSRPLSILPTTISHLEVSGGPYLPSCAATGVSVFRRSLDGIILPF